MPLESLRLQLAERVEQASAAFASAENEDVLNQIKARFVGKAGDITSLLRSLKDVAPEDRPAFGQAVNEARELVEALLEQHRVRIREAQLQASLASRRLDLTLPPRTEPVGGLHPLRRVEQRMIEVLKDMGYALATGPQVETDFHNFEALNFPADHPARDMQDTFMVEGGRLLRTHTSPVQIRTMLAYEPPIRILAPGAVYRCDTPDMTHSPCFNQVEGLFIDRGDVTLAQLKGTLREFASRLFGRELKIRFRPSFFPFTEPSVEADVQCPFCESGCRVCKHTGFIEILGAGLVDPEVFRACGMDPDEVSGFAFGVGVERVAMLLYDVDDMRHFYDNDVRFIAQFA